MCEWVGASKQQHSVSVAQRVTASMCVLYLLAFVCELFCAQHCGLCAGKSVAKVLVEGAPDSASAVVKCVRLDASDATSIQQLAALVKQDYDQQIDLIVSVSFSFNELNLEVVGWRPGGWVVKRLGTYA